MIISDYFFEEDFFMFFEVVNFIDFIWNEVIGSFIDIFVIFVDFIKFEDVEKVEVILFLLRKLLDVKEDVSVI